MILFLTPLLAVFSADFSPIGFIAQLDLCLL
jgi:hypothetical protein